MTVDTQLANKNDLENDGKEHGEKEGVLQCTYNCSVKHFAITCKKITTSSFRKESALS
ncbi:hypothetical protein DPMN_031662 [Dreissena polymorpha]|uniref:Uncharacterized protein n=1 Tax=Dreissena polymorpha TaxID=45954 RepID=A0A9D4M3J0_DREPO|nr:hypothetical protein DPMN_031662 [Dreissena polymorpha]